MKKFLKMCYMSTLSLALLFSFFATPISAYSEEQTNAIFSEETIEWLEKFNSLSLEEQLSVNHRPREVVEYLSSNKKSLDILEDVVYIENISYSSNYSHGTREIVPSDPGSGGMVTGGYELAYNPSYWNGSRIKYANCYYYAMNVVSSSNNINHQQPGYLAGNIYASLTGYNIFLAAKRDVPYFSNVVSIRSSSQTEVPGVKEYKVALVIAPGFDYHWYRQNPNGTWSHKRGQTAVTNVDASGYIISNPQTCNRKYSSIVNYTTFAGFYIVKYA